MKFINLIKESNIDTELKEVITSGSVIVYHRTGKNGSPVQGIAADGYRVGSGDMYGVGVYTTYDLQSQLNNNMRSTYGNIIIESKVLSMKDFLIFDYDMAKRIYGNKNYTLSRQLRLIFGNEFKNIDNKELKELIIFGDEQRDINIDIKKLEELLSVSKYSSDVAWRFYKKYENIISKLRGIVFTGQNDGRVLVSYDRKNVEPLRYTLDEGKTWKNIINKNIYQRLKGYDDDSNNLEYEHILNKLNANKELNDEEINILLNNKESILNSDEISNILKYSSNPDKVINKLLNNKELISNLDTKGINILLEKILLKERDDIINILLNNKELISNLDTNGINNILLKKSLFKEREYIINILLNSKELISRLDSNGINNLIYYSSEREKVINILLNSKELISNLDNRGISTLIDYSIEPEKVINLLGNKGKEYLSRLDDPLIFGLLVHSIEPEKVFNLLGNKGVDYLSRLDDYTIDELLGYSKNSKQMEQIIKQLRPDLFDKNIQENIKRIKILMI